jgi:hypothetical protein
VSSVLFLALIVRAVQRRLHPVFAARAVSANCGDQVPLHERCEIAKPSSRFAQRRHFVLELF